MIEHTNYESKAFNLKPNQLIKVFSNQNRSTTYEEEKNNEYLTIIKNSQHNQEFQVKIENNIVENKISSCLCTTRETITCNLLELEIVQFLNLEDLNFQNCIRCDITTNNDVFSDSSKYSGKLEYVKFRLLYLITKVVDLESLIINKDFFIAWKIHIEISILWDKGNLMTNLWFAINALLHNLKFFKLKSNAFIDCYEISNLCVENVFNKNEIVNYNFLKTQTIYIVSCWSEHLPENQFMYFIDDKDLNDYQFVGEFFIDVTSKNILQYTIKKKKTYTTTLLDDVCQRMISDINSKMSTTFKLMTQVNL